MNITSKLPNVGTSIFAVMSALATEHRAINLSQGFPDFDCSERLQGLVAAAMSEGWNQYAPMPGLLRLRERIAEKIDLLYQKTVNPADEITITAGGTQAIFTAITTFIKAGDEVIVIEPAYDCYLPPIELVGGVPVIYSMQAPDYRIDWDKMAALVTPKTKMLMFNTPHNPTGTVWSAADFVALQNLVKNTNILVISDEVYEHLVYDNASHESILSYPDLYERSIVIYSFGKTFHTTGWKMGYCVASPLLTAEFRKVHQFNVFSVNTPIQHALSEFLASPNEYLSLNNFYQAKRDFLLAATANSKFRPLPCAGTYFQLLDYSQISDESDVVFARHLTTEIGVAVIPVSAFYSDGYDGKVVRLCFAKKESTLLQAAELLNTVC